LGPKEPESKRGWVDAVRRNYPIFVMAGLDPAIHVLLFQLRTKKAWIPGSPWRENARLPGHDGELFAGLLSARLLQNRETLDAR
jgi:hypothetical protein